MFTRLSYEVSRPITLLLEETSLLEEVPREEKVIFEKKTQRAGGTKEKLEKVKGGKPVPSLLPVATKSGDVSVASKETTEESILSEIERKVKSRKAEATHGKPTVSESFGELSGVVSGSGVDLTKSATRKILYIPPFPQLRATELPSTFQAKLWVEPSGRVSKVEVLKRSGVPE
ncbi:energy transducer TonB, partial [Thermocrinis sp.]|uniref:energy transducer TonB n=1 Tax=Thermocrinis sp. TaxID=2024383 RepID=UPI003BFAB8A5